MTVLYYLKILGLFTIIFFWSIQRVQFFRPPAKVFKRHVDFFVGICIT